MKKQFFIPGLSVLLGALLMIGCDKTDNSTSAASTTVTNTAIVATSAVSSQIDSFVVGSIDSVKCKGYVDNGFEKYSFEIARGLISSSGSFSMTLSVPTTAQMETLQFESFVDSSSSYISMGKFEGSLSVNDAMTTEGEFITTKNKIETGYLYKVNKPLCFKQQAGFCMSKFVYSNKDCVIKGVYYSSDISLNNILTSEYVKEKFNVSLSKGWNEISVSIDSVSTSLNSRREVVSYSSVVPSGMKWKWGSYAYAEFKSVELKQCVEKPLFGHRRH